MADRIVLEVMRDGWTDGLQLGISRLDENNTGHGYRLAGPKFNGSSKPLLIHDIDQRDADEIRRYLDAVFPPSRLPQVWSISGATYDYPERFATRELAQAAAEIQWCNENDPDAEPKFEWAEGDETGIFEALIDGVALEWTVQAHELIWSRPDEDDDR